MDINLPEFVMRNQRYPCLCGGEGILLFITCPSCGFVTVCDEIGEVFSDPHDLNTEPILSCISDDDLCPNCQKNKLKSFKNSTLNEIQRAGLAGGAARRKWKKKAVGKS